MRALSNRAFEIGRAIKPRAIQIADGTVCAVNSTGFETNDISYVTCIASALDLVISDIRLPGDSSPRETTLRELAERGFCLIR